MSLLAISDTHKREKTNLLATKSPTFGSHSSANGHVPHALSGQGVWWDRNDRSIIFKDGDGDPNFKDEGPSLKHFRSCHLSDVQHAALCAWDKILSLNITIPLSDQYVHLYDGNGSFTGFRNSTIDAPNDCIVNVHDDVILDTTDSSTICKGTCSSETSLHVMNDSEICCLPSQPLDVQAMLESHIASTPCCTTLETANTIEPNTVHVVIGHEEFDTDVGTHGKALFRLLGFSENLKMFDTVHYRLRQKKKANLPLPGNDKHAHSQLLAMFQTKVSERLSRLKIELHDVEVSYYKTHGCASKADDVDVLSLLKKQRLAKKLLAEWHVNI